LEPGSITAIKLFLRRTLVLFVINAALKITTLLCPLNSQLTTHSLITITSPFFQRITDEAAAFEISSCRYFTV